jgi:CBS domain-containing protein
MESEVQLLNQEAPMMAPVRKIMTNKLITVPMGTTAFEAGELMQERRIRHLPVIDELDDLVGIVSQRDLHAISNLKTKTVEMMMSAPVHFVNEKTPLRHAIFSMLQNKISCLLVSDDNDHAIGIVTTDDLLWYLSHVLNDETDKSLPILNYKSIQTIGTVARELSDMGI